jgi:uncharacterized Ntn-hydrolase superfamily protein
MTFSIVGRCEQTGQLGIAIATSSIAVGARCPWLRAGVGAVSTQNVTLPALGSTILDRIQKNETAQTALQSALTVEAWPEYRQVIAIDRTGRTAMFSGTEMLGVHNMVEGMQCVAAGNLLANAEVINAMIHAFETSSGHLASRLLASMHGAAAAGGEAGPLHSAALQVVADVAWPIADLRIDWAEEDPLGELSKLWEKYAPQLQDYLTRALNPTAAPSYGVPGDE